MKNQMSVQFFGGGGGGGGWWVETVVFLPGVFRNCFSVVFSEISSIWTLNGLFQSDNSSLSSALGDFLEIFL